MAVLNPLVAQEPPLVLPVTTIAHPGPAQRRISLHAPPSQSSPFDLAAHSVAACFAAPSTVLPPCGQATPIPTEPSLEFAQAMAARLDEMMKVRK